MNEEYENYTSFRKTRYRASQTVVTSLSASQSDEEIRKGKEAVLPDSGATHASQSLVWISAEDLEARRQREAEEAERLEETLRAEEHASKSKRQNWVFTNDLKSRMEISRERQENSGGFLESIGPSSLKYASR